MKDTLNDHADQAEVLATFTPGPWEFAQTSSGDDRFDIYQAEHAWTVARTVNNAHVDCREANARLIAASPDLLLNLSALVGRIETMAGALQRKGEGAWVSAWLSDNLIEDCRAAITKATRG